MNLSGRTGTPFLTNKDMRLTDRQLQRYSRTIALPEIGDEGQSRICAGSVLVVGAGALGSVVALYLAGAGVGEIGLVDYDVVEEHNLQRQVAYTMADLDMPKAEALSQRLTALNPGVKVKVYLQKLSRANAADLFRNYDVIVEATDSPVCKHFVPELAVNHGLPCVVGGVAGWTGQVTTCMPGSDCSFFTELFGAEPTAGNDRMGTLPEPPGVFGPAAGAVACFQAAEVLKLIAKAGRRLDGRLLLIDMLSGGCRTLTL